MDNITEQLHQLITSLLEERATLEIQVVNLKKRTKELEASLQTTIERTDELNHQKENLLRQIEEMLPLQESPENILLDKDHPLRKKLFTCWCKGHKIEAIKMIRTATGRGLKESKAVADELWERWGCRD